MVGKFIAIMLVISFVGGIIKAGQFTGRVVNKVDKWSKE